MGNDAKVAAKKAAEQKRLAEALRANLRRRKAARPGPPPIATDPVPDVAQGPANADDR